MGGLWATDLIKDDNMKQKVCQTFCKPKSNQFILHQNFLNLGQKLNNRLR